jgi:hypothetical protein
MKFDTFSLANNHTFIIPIIEANISIVLESVIFPTIKHIIHDTIANIELFASSEHFIINDVIFYTIDNLIYLRYINVPPY